jgi:hypothetical protein
MTTPSQRDREQPRITSIDPRETSICEPIAQHDLAGMLDAMLCETGGPLTGRERRRIDVELGVTGRRRRRA